MRACYAALAAASAPGVWGQLAMDNVAPQPLLRAGDFPAPRFVTQRQDHFDDANERVWQQAYYVNDTYWVPGSDAPIFLCVGGEGPPLDGSAVVSSVHCNLAVEWLGETGALMFAIEHRYYGCHNMSACPVDNFDNPKEALKYLSSKQAIEDVASFVKQMNAQYQLTEKNKWVTWGGSYPGMLAGWSRLRHPELIHASVASSAPVHAKLDMFEYNDVVADAYAVSDNDVGGSPACTEAIREGHRIIEDLLLANKTEEAEKLLSMPQGSLADRSQRQSLGYGLAYFPSQGNDPACTDPACNIKSICQIMLNTSLGDALTRVLAVRQAQEGTGLLRQHRRRPRLSVAAGEQPDFWFYQTCTEFGFYQSCSPGSKCPYVRGYVDVASESAGCQELYDISIPEIEENIQATNKHYGALEPQFPDGQLGNCVLWPNGEVDPWAALSVLKTPGAGQPVLWVPGASHHFWTHPAYPTDQPSVVLSRQLIREQVKAFLAQPCGQRAEQAVVV